MYVTKDSPFPSGRRTLRTELGDIPAGTVAWRRGMRLMAPLARCNRGEAEAVPCQKKGRTGGGAPGRQKVGRRSVLPLNVLISQPGHVDHERDSTPIHSVFVN